MAQALVPLQRAFENAAWCFSAKRDGDDAHHGNSVRAWIVSRMPPEVNVVRLPSPGSAVEWGCACRVSDARGEWGPSTYGFQDGATGPMRPPGERR